MYKVIILDADGTLIHTPLHYIKNILELTLSKFSKKIKINSNEVKNFWYKPKKSEFIKNHFGIEDMDIFWDEFNKNDSPINRGKVISIYNDVSFLYFLKNKYNLKYGILTNAHPEITEIELDFLGKDLIDIVVNSHPHNGIKSKPDPEGARYILNKFGVNNNEGVLVGDSEVDIFCARNVPMEEILIDRGEYKNKIDAKNKINRLTDMWGFLENAY